ncbi:alpha/beta fold hydrolase [Microbacterium sp. P01]|uniref:alpha/beta fold hydrolase n=1 Tax=Microbacterium sp. P01 TaxID=3366261 RepID=UPI003671E8C0
MAKASLPPKDLPELDPRFSRTLRVPVGGDRGASHEWHYLDNRDALAERGIPVTGTILAVHGNPTWSYLWRRLVAGSVDTAQAGAPAWRVIAVDQLDMGFSERVSGTGGAHRTLAQRVRDLAAFTDELGIEGPVVTLGHDWGGVVSLGWAVDHPDLLAGVLLLNTAVHHPDGVPIPAPLRLAGARGMLSASTVRSTAFLDTTLALASPALAPAVKDAYRAPYRTARRRHGIGGFVADIPVGPGHESFAELERISAGVAALTVPALFLWGPRDPIFVDRYLDDLIGRMPHADVHRFEGAGHLLAEDRPYQETVLTWLDDNADRLTHADVSSPEDGHGEEAGEGQEEASFTPLWRRLDDRREDDDAAVIDMATGAGRAPRRVSWRRLDDRVRRIASGLTRIGVRPGDRVSLLVPPGPTLTAVVYACLRIGAVVVVADAGLGVRGLTRAVRGARPDFLIGETRGLAAARALGWPGVRIAAEGLSAPVRAALGVSHSLGEVAALGDPDEILPAPGPRDTAAILFTSGSTGPAKGVVYTHAQLSALRDVLAAHFDIAADTGLVTGFAPFALLGPALGTRSVTPDMDVSSPRTLTAAAVAAAVRASDARIVFLSPAAILNVVATAGELTAGDREALGGVQTFLSTGAPIGRSLLESSGELMPNATAHTPYGMTECLLLTDITLDGIRSAATEPDDGVCVGTPIGSNRVLVSALDHDGRATGSPHAGPGVLGEIVVSARHLKTGYDRLWATDRAAERDTPRTRSPDERWHRTGDVGHLDDRGRLWVEGRLPHVIVTATGPVAPVGAEQDIETVPAVRRAAIVGIGPRGLQQVVAIVETVPPSARAALAGPELAAEIRASTPLPLAAVLVVPRLPTDIRHNSKIDRSRLARWAEGILAGRKPTAP